MSGSIVFRVTSTTCSGQEKQVSEVLCAVRNLANKRNILLPKKTSIGGTYFNTGSICFTTTKMKDLLVEVLNEKQYEIVDIW